MCIRDRGTVPYIDNKKFKTTLTLQYEDKTYSEEINIGNFKIHIPITIDSNKIKIKLRFSNKMRLPNGDNRVISAIIDKIGFVD